MLLKPSKHHLWALSTCLDWQSAQKLGSLSAAPQVRKMFASAFASVQISLILEVYGDPEVHPQHEE